MKRRAAAALGLPVALLLASACGVSATPPATGRAAWQFQQPGRDAGEDAARALLDAAAIPPGSRRLKQNPVPELSDVTRPVDDNLVDDTRYWHVDLGLTDLVAYLSGHVPDGLVPQGSGGSSGPHQQSVTDLRFVPAPPVRAAGRPALVYTIVQDGFARSWLRVDGQAIWYPARPTSETASAGSIVTAEVTGGRRQARHVLDPTTSARLVDEFDHLIRNTPTSFAGGACLSDSGSLTLTFTPAGSTSASLAASRSSCGLDWTVRDRHGHRLPALEAAGALFADALRALGLSDDDLLSPRVPLPRR